MDSYIIDKRIGQSQFEVYQITEKATKKTLAVKIIEIPEQDLEKENEILNECSLLSFFVDHESFVSFKGVTRDIVQIQNSNIKKVRYGIVMDLMKGSLEDEIKVRVVTKHYYDIAEISKFVDQTYDGFVLLESKKIAHRDIKPGNILLDKLGNYKIADLGVSKFVKGGIGTTGTWVGTLTYISSELMEEYLMHAEQTHCNPLISDVFSYGLTLLRMVTLENVAGINLQDGDNKKKILFDKIRDVYQESAPYLIQFLDKLLERDQNKRKNFRENQMLASILTENVINKRVKELFDVVDEGMTGLLDTNGILNLCFLLDNSIPKEEIKKVNMF